MSKWILIPIPHGFRGTGYWHGIMTQPALIDLETWNQMKTTGFLPTKEQDTCPEPAFDLDAHASGKPQPMKMRT